MDTKSMNDNKKDISTRLKKIEGQIKGIEKMVESDTGCSEILVQVAAVRAAINKVGSMVFENYAQNCICNEGSPENIQNLIKTLNMFIK